MDEICKPCTREELDEILEEIWTTLELQGETPSAGSRIPAALSAQADRLVEDGLARQAGKELVLTEPGFQKAKEIIRSHRLAERLLHDVLNLQSEEMEAAESEKDSELTEEQGRRRTAARLAPET